MCVCVCVTFVLRFAPYFVEPVVAGLEGEDNSPYLVAMDLIGAAVFAKDFVVCGTAAEALYGVCESFWKPDMVSSPMKIWGERKRS